MASVSIGQGGKWHFASTNSKQHAPNGIINFPTINMQNDFK
jgi:hypothetical protein